MQSPRRRSTVPNVNSGAVRGREREGGGYLCEGLRRSCSCCALCRATHWGGANLGGSLILHATSVVYTTDIGSYCDQSGIEACSTAVASVPWDLDQQIVFVVVSAFPPESSPRLKGISFGIDYDPTKFVIMAHGSCADFELADSGWPGPGTGTGQTWTTTQTGSLIESYWFVGYCSGEQSADTTSFRLTPHPRQGGVFVDDGDPRESDQIAAYGRLGIGTMGALPCPEGGGDMVWVPSSGFGGTEGQLDAFGDLTFVEIASTSAGTYATTHRALKSDYGLRVLIGIVPDALICRTDEWQRSALTEDERVNRVTVEAIQDAPGYLLPGDPAFAEGVWISCSSRSPRTRHRQPSSRTPRVSTRRWNRGCGPRTRSVRLRLT